MIDDYDPVVVELFLDVCYDSIDSIPMSKEAYGHYLMDVAQVYAMADYYLAPIVKLRASRETNKVLDRMRDFGVGYPNFLPVLELVWNSTPSGNTGLRHLYIEALRFEQELWEKDPRFYIFANSVEGLSEDVRSWILQEDLSQPFPPGQQRFLYCQHCKLFSTTGNWLFVSCKHCSRLVCSGMPDHTEEEWSCNLPETELDLALT